jgi:hypothetical protein
MRDAIEDYDGLFVAAVGNNNYETDETDRTPYPASYGLPNIIAVMAIDEDNQRWVRNADMGSNFGSHVHIAAPGARVMTAVALSNNNQTLYTYVDGTSVAAPHVTGVAALLLSLNPTLTTAELKNLILSSATSIEITTPQGTEATVGLLNAKNALLGTVLFGIVEQPASQTQTYSSNLNVSMRVRAESMTNIHNNLRYQWYVNTSNSYDDAMPILQATTSTFQLPASTNAGEYYYFCELIPIEHAEQSMRSRIAHIVIEKADPSYVVPTGISSVLGANLASVQLPGGWEWEDPTSLVGQVGIRNHPALLYPIDAANYNVIRRNVPVTVEYQIPVANILAVPQTIRTNQWVVLNPTIQPTNASYQNIAWTVTNAGTTGAVVSRNELNAASDGTISIRATIRNGKGIGEDYTQEFSIQAFSHITSTPEIHQISNILVYPNPTRDILNIEFLQNQQFKISIIDLRGNILMEKTFVSAGVQTIDIGNYAEGMYILIIKDMDDKQVGTWQIIKL